MRCARHVACTGVTKNSYKILDGKPEGKRPLGRPQHRWDDIPEWILGKQWEDVDLIHLTHERNQ
jgi:hypothetical protein